jgi:hypothetical protein
MRGEKFENVFCRKNVRDMEEEFEILIQRIIGESSWLGLREVEVLS